MNRRLVRRAASSVNAGRHESASVADVSSSGSVTTGPSATTTAAGFASMSGAVGRAPTPSEILQWLDYPQVRQAIFALVAEEALRSQSPLGRAIGLPRGD